MKRFLFLVPMLIFAYNGIYGQNSLTVADTRNVPTTPESYSRSFALNFKRADSLQLAGSGGNYVALMGLRPWADNSGGKAHELAFAQNSNIYMRSGLAPAWENWRRVISEDVNGSVTIGTLSAQAAKLHVATGESLTSNANILLSSGDNHRMWFCPSLVASSYNNIVLQGDQAIIYGGATAGTGSLAIAPWASATSGIRIDRTGNVSIGTPDAKGYKLAVAGSLVAEKVKVKAQSGWPDYVFHSDYQLPGLQELAAYIDAHKHLPGIPSAAEMEREGMDVAEMNKRLLEKIEELTLYVIKLSEENRDLKRSVEDLRKVTK